MRFGPAPEKSGELVPGRSFPTDTGSLTSYYSMNPPFLAAFSLVFCLAASAPGQSADAGLPATAVGKALGQFINALNSGKLAELQKFHRDRGGDPQAADQDLGFYEQSGGVDLGKVIQASEYEIEVEAKTRREARAVILRFAVEPNPPHPVSDIGVRPLGTPRRDGAPPPPGGPPGDKDEPQARRPAAEVVAAAPGIVDKAIASGFSGAVLIALDGKTLLTKAAGLANRADGTPNRADTKFNLGSINKLFTKIAIAQLMAAGKLTLDTKLAAVLPGFPTKEASEKITISHLIEMRSGIGDFFGPAFEAAPKEKIRTLQDYIPLFASKPLAFEPGASQAYSNGGYLTLGLVIEKLSAETYYDYVRDHIFKPALMSDTDSYFRSEKTPNRAIGYTRRGGADYKSNVDALPERGSSAGGGYSTAGDLLKFTEALLANRLLDGAHTAWILGAPKPLSPPPPADAPRRGGLGIAGGSPGVNGVLEINAAQKLVVVVLSNDDPPAAETLARQIRTGR